MTATIVNAAPMTRLLGTQDKSTRPLVREPEARPTHLPKVYIYAEKGDTNPHLVVGDSRTQIYGENTFDMRKPWANHATLFSNLINAEGNAQMMERVRPADAGPEANILLSLDVLPTQVTDYERNTDGSIKLDANDDPIPLLDAQSNPVTVAGYKVKFVTSHINTVAGLSSFGNATIGAGTQTAGAVQSQRYPIIEMKASSFGAWANNIGFRLWAPASLTAESVDSTILKEGKFFPYRMSVVKRSTATGTSKVVETLFGEQSVQVSLKKGAINPATDEQIYVGNKFLDSYQNVKDVNYPPLIGDFGAIAIYDNNIQTLLNLFYTAEMAYINASSNPSSILTDFEGVTGEEHLFNFISGTSSHLYPYHTYQVIDAVGSVRPSEFTNLYAAGGSDGTMNNTLFAGLVTDRIAEYNNPNSPVLDTAVNVESIVYDSGFPLQTKYALLNFIAIRKDTFVNLSTFTAGGPRMTASEENAMAIALRTRAELYPESDYFGTPVMRAMVMGRNGKMRSSTFTEYVPALAEVAIKSARYMGAGNGKWKSGFHFDGEGQHIVENIYDVNVTFTPAAARNRDWDAGLNWIQSYDRSSLFIPALKTVYSNDTSVLNSYFTALAICEITKICEQAWRYFSGTAHLTDAQLAERVNKFITDAVKDKFDGRFVIQPNTYFTDADLARGYSWTTAVDLYAPNMKTVMTTFVRAFRLSDLTATA